MPRTFDDVAAGAARLGDERQQIHGDVRIGAEAQLHLSVHRTPRHKVRDHVHAARQCVARNVRVVGADIVPLRMADVEQRTRIEKKLDDLHIAGDIPLVQVSHVIQGYGGAE